MKNKQPSNQQQSLFGETTDNEADVAVWVPTSSASVPRLLDSWRSPARLENGVVLYGITRATIRRLINDHPNADVPECVLDLLQQWGSRAHPGKRNRKPPTYRWMASAIVEVIDSAARCPESPPPTTILSLDPVTDTELVWRAAISA